MAYLAMGQLRHTAAAKEDTLLHKTLQEQERQKEQGYGWLKGIQKRKILPEANQQCCRYRGMEEDADKSN